jgi:hypothetical protein
MRDLAVAHAENQHPRQMAGVLFFLQNVGIPKVKAAARLPPRWHRPKMKAQFALAMHTV